jgi:hypothetical protein
MLFDAIADAATYSACQCRDPEYQSFGALTGLYASTKYVKTALQMHVSLVRIQI